MFDEIEMLDSILLAIKDEIRFHSLEEICDSYGMPLDLAKFVLCRRHLVKDGYITQQTGDDPNQIRITIEGLNFIKSGGYAEAALRKKRKMKRDDVIKWVTLSIAIASFIKSFFINTH